MAYCLQPNHLYRVSKIIDNPKIAGRVVHFVRYVDRHFDIRRAEVATVETGGELGARWLVNPHYIIPL